MGLSTKLYGSIAIAGLLVAACGGSTTQRERLAGVEVEAPGETGGAAPGAGAGPQQGGTAAPGEQVPAPPDAGQGPGSGENLQGQGGGSVPQPGGEQQQPDAQDAQDAQAGNGAASGDASGGRMQANSTGSGGEAAPDTGVTAESIKVGHVGIYSGPVGEFGQDLSEGSLSALQYANDQGGVNGRKLDILIEDDSWDASKGLAKVRKLVEQDEVFALVGTQSVPTTNAAASYVDKVKVPHVGTDGWGEPQYTSQYTYPTGVSTSTEARLMAQRDAEAGVQRVGILYLNNESGQLYNEVYAEEIAKHGGEVIVSQAANFDDPNTSSFVLQCRSDGCDKINVWSDPGIYARMVIEASQQRYKPPQGFGGTNGLYFSATPDMAGSWSEGTVATTYFYPNDSEEAGLKEYVDIVEGYYPDIMHTGWTKAGFSGSRMFVDALKSLGRGNETRENLKNHLDGLSDYNSGLGVNFSFSPESHRANKTVYFAQIQDGRWVTVDGPVVDEGAG